MRFSGMEILIVVIILVIVFGASRLPSIASSLGKSAKVLKKEMKELNEDDKPREVTDEQDPDRR